ncbi:hypothetical protein BC828DRAFT_389482, partial [Blastocladiella britannica]
RNRPSKTVRKPADLAILAFPDPVSSRNRTPFPSKNQLQIPFPKPPKKSLFN